MQSSINGDLTVRVVVDTNALSWAPSPSGTVWRKRLHLVGPAESGQVTSVVRYEPGARFPTHDHPDGEEILVLDGVFSDEHGDWPAGTYLLNPHGFRHAPYSREGCHLFVKLRQFPGVTRRHVVCNTEAAPWLPGPRLSQRGAETKLLYSQEGYTDTTRLERWPAGWAGEASYAQGAELLVLEGAFEDDQGAYGPRTWLRFPAGAQHRPRTSTGCILYVKEGGFAYLKSA